jgi:hypothetical protein
MTILAYKMHKMPWMISYKKLGVYTEAVNIIFDEEELTDSDDEDFEETQQDQASNATKNLTGR